MWITKKMWERQKRKIDDLERKVQSQQTLIEKMRQMLIKLGCRLD